MRSRSCWFILGFVSAMLFAAESMAVPVFSLPIEKFPTSKDVFCGDTKCGTMSISDYFAVERLIDLNDPATVDPADDTPFEGVRIKGKFDPAKSGIFHYIQAVTTDDSPPKFKDGSALTVPYIDTPPGGYQGDPFDLLPYYDEGEFPDFFDEPKNSLGLIKAAGMITVRFETWLVCLIDEKFGVDLKKAMDDSFEVAALLGWEWGFKSTFTDNMDGVLDFADVATVPLDFRFIMGDPTADWTKALDQVYGDKEKDRFNVKVGKCENCIPEPSNLGVWAIPTLFVLAVVMRRRRVRA